MVFNLISLAGRPSTLSPRGAALWMVSRRRFFHHHRSTVPCYGISTPTPESAAPAISKSPFCFETGYAVCAKRPSRPFPPPFVSPPSTSFSDPLTTHFRSQDKRPWVDGELIRGLTNGDDAVLVSENYIGVNDGVGAWATKAEGHAALWSRLILHFWALEVEKNVNDATPDPVEFLQRAYEYTVEATSSPNGWLGTTTSTTALLHYTCNNGGHPTPLLYVTNLGDCEILVIRPREKKVVFKTEGQWHWFDCPFQLGTNSTDTPRKNAVFNKLELEENDIVLALSDGVVDNLWEHEVLKVILASIERWEAGKTGDGVPDIDRTAGKGGMVYLAKELLEAAKIIAQDPFAESPYMEKAIEEGLTIEGGKMDDISIVVGRCTKREHEADMSID
ncbi:hypothetical protein AJ80_08639 [Polytolypa hystricis UAMH7299]|uniref:Protein phosphatase n=1 Tax=Polytolypa hystricis (strain UAMH7299) TaxID=1447883 RepID=A0A2B7X4F3_POLH7|nr:hypothetical protein AJ80_08639 [Polytolypa hystricis UAMH7299]